MLAEIYREEWGLDAMLDSQVLRETQAIFGKAIEKGVPRSTPHQTAFKQRLKTSTDVFSVFRVHRQAEDIAAHLTDEHGNRRSFGEWAERVQPYLNHQNRAWLQTEYSTAIRRAHDEADWVRFREDADIYPNLEWVPSTSARPGADHKVFWGTVLPIGDEFWTEHRPGDRWNCKCSLRQTDKAPTATPRVSGKQHEPQAGLRAKPGSEEVFSDDHAYYPSDCRMCLFGRSASRLRHLLGNLGGKGGRTLASSCYECRYRAACMENRNAKVDERKTTKIVEEVVANGFSRHQPVVVGNIAPKVFEFIEDQRQMLKSENIYLTQERVAHALRKSKTERGAALTKEEMANVCDYLRRADVYYDPTHENLIYVVKNRDRLLKFAVQINYKIKKVGIVNAVVTAGVITPDNLIAAHYIKIK